MNELFKYIMTIVLLILSTTLKAEIIEVPEGNFLGIGETSDGPFFTLMEATNDGLSQVVIVNPDIGPLVICRCQTGCSSTSLGGCRLGISVDENGYTASCTGECIDNNNNSCGSCRFQ